MKRDYNRSYATVLYTDGYAEINCDCNELHFKSKFVANREYWIVYDNDGKSLEYIMYNGLRLPITDKLGYPQIDYDKKIHLKTANGDSVQTVLFEKIVLADSDISNGVHTYLIPVNPNQGVIRYKIID